MKSAYIIKSLKVLIIFPLIIAKEGQRLALTLFSVKIRNNQINTILRYVNNIKFDIEVFVEKKL